MGLSINTTDFNALSTKKLVARFADNISPTAFGMSFFKQVEADTLEVSVEVQRSGEPIAIDLPRGANGNVNTFDKSTEKLFIPPYYAEEFFANHLSVYDELVRSLKNGGDAALFGRFIDTLATKMKFLTDKIDRSYEKQCWDVFQTGVITLANSTTIDFKRKALSMVNLTGAYWDGGSVDPNTSLLTAAKWLREVGLSSGAVLNVILGESALNAYLNNTAVKARGSNFNYSLDNVTMAQRNAVGASYHGRISVGSYLMDLWTYPQVYTATVGGAATPYLDPKKIVVLPQVTANVLSYAAIPQLLVDGQMPKKGKFVFDNYIDTRKKNHIFDVQSAGLAIPVAVDQIYTAQVLA